MNEPILEPIGASLVRSFTRTHSSPPDGVLGSAGILAAKTVQFGAERLHSVFQTILTRARLGRPNHTRGDVSDAGTVLVLVAVLSAAARSGEPRDLEIAWGTTVIDGVRPGARDDGNGHGRAMDSSASFGRGDALDSVTTGLVVEAGYGLALKFDAEGLVSGARVRSMGRAGLSTLAEGEVEVGGREFGDE